MPQGLSPQEAIKIAKQVIENPPTNFLPEEASEIPAEQLIRMVAAFFSLGDTKLRDAIIREAQNRVMTYQATGLPPWAR
jgi:hypothetical protein